MFALLQADSGTSRTEPPMNTSRRERIDATAAGFGKAKSLGILATIMLVVGILLSCYFLVPKLEANLQDFGIRPHPAVAIAIHASHFVNDYLWLITLSSFALVYASARSTARVRAEIPRD
jgi:hypothetical protein